MVACLAVSLIFFEEEASTQSTKWYENKAWALILRAMIPFNFILLAGNDEEKCT